MSRSPHRVTRFSVVIRARLAASWENGRPSGIPSTRIRASRSVSADDSRARLSAPVAGVMSTSNVGVAEPRSAAAKPPMSTYCTSWRCRTSSSTSGSNLVTVHSGGRPGQLERTSHKTSADPVADRQSSPKLSRAARHRADRVPALREPSPDRWNMHVQQNPPRSAADHLATRHQLELPLSLAA
jgi:hypothetical protein